MRWQGTLLHRIERSAIEVYGNSPHPLDVLALAALHVGAIDCEEHASAALVELPKSMGVLGERPMQYACEFAVLARAVVVEGLETDFFGAKDVEQTPRLLEVNRSFSLLHGFFVCHVGFLVACVLF